MIKAQPKVFTLEEDNKDDGDIDKDDIFPSSPNISESSDSDVVLQRQKPHRTRFF